MAISIHALLAESDKLSPKAKNKSNHFYPRSPCGERPTNRRPIFLIGQFLSTLSLRRATTSTALSIQPTKFLSTLSLRRATVLVVPRGCWLPISIHALLAESDATNRRPIFLIGQFLSTLSLRRATSKWFDLWGWAEYFYPRSPCGERPENPMISVDEVPFLSTLSLRRATTANTGATKSDQISIHALLAESDFTTTITTCIASKFLSTLSLRRATGKLNKLAEKN